MNHRPFEEWLLSDETLSGEQTQELQAHLRACDRCRQLDVGWSGVQRLFRATPDITPPAGFTTRWQERLTAQQQKKHHRLPWLLLSITASIAVVFLILLGIQFWRTFNSPAQWLLIKAYGLSIYLWLSEMAETILNALYQLVARFPVVLWAYFFAVGGFLCVLWISIGRQLVAIGHSAFEAK